MKILWNHKVSLYEILVKHKIPRSVVKEYLDRYRKEKRKKEND